VESLISRGVRRRHVNERLLGNSRDPHTSGEDSISESVTVNIRCRAEVLPEVYEGSRMGS